MASAKGLSGVETTKGCRVHLLARLAVVVMLLSSVGIVASNSLAFASPFNLTISGASGNCGTLGPVVEASGSCTTINATELATQLASGSVEIVASGNITVSDSIISTNNANSDNLTLKAGGNIIVNNAVQITTQGGNIVLQSATADGAITGSIRLGSLNNTAGSISSNGGNIMLSGGSNPLTDYALASSDIETDKSSAGVAVYGFSVNSGNGNILVRGNSFRTGGERTRGILLDESGGGLPTFTATGSGRIELVGLVQSATGTSTSHWALNIRAGRFETVTGRIDLNGRVETTGGSEVNRRGVSAEGNFVATSAIGNITVEDSTTVAGHQETLFAAAGTTRFTTAGNVQIIGNKVANGTTLEFNTPQAEILSYEAPSFTSSLTVGKVTANNANNLTIGRPGNASAVTLNEPITVGGPTTIHGSTLAINGSLQAPGSVITLHASTEATQTASINSDRLSLNGLGDFTLENTGNNVATIAGGSVSQKLGSLSFTDAADGLTIGDVGPLQGIHASGGIRLVTLSGNINVSRPVTSDVPSSDAIFMYANQPAPVDDAGDGDIIVSGTGAVLIESGARALLYSGAATTSTGLSQLAGAASNIRTRVDADTALADINPALGNTGLFVLYRVEGTGLEASAGGQGSLRKSSSAGTQLDQVNANQLAATGVSPATGLLLSSLSLLLIGLGSLAVRKRARASS